MWNSTSFIRRGVQSYTDVILRAFCPSWARAQLFDGKRAAQQVDRWLVVTTSLEGEGAELAQLIREILGVVENDPELAGFEIQTARHV